MRETIVFIDDPISSLDTNHISQVYSLINSYFFRKKIDKVDPEKVVNCFKQLFISTHSFEFFSFLMKSSQLNRKKIVKDLTRGKSPKVDTCGHYQIQKLSSENSVLKDLEKSLKNHKSEYVYLFKLIHDYRTGFSEGKDQYDIVIPNVLRRFLEIYTLMKIPNEDSLQNRINVLVGDVNDFKTLHHFSHFTSFEKLTRHDELVMCLPKACNELFRLLEKDEKHFESLMKVIR